MEKNSPCLVTDKLSPFVAGFSCLILECSGKQSDATQPWPLLDETSELGLIMTELTGMVLKEAGRCGPFLPASICKLVVNGCHFGG